MPNDEKPKPLNIEISEKEFDPSERKAVRECLTAVFGDTERAGLLTEHRMKKRRDALAMAALPFVVPAICWAFWQLVAVDHPPAGPASIQEASESPEPWLLEE